MHNIMIVTETLVSIFGKAFGQKIVESAMLFEKIMLKKGSDSADCPIVRAMFLILVKLY